MMMAAITDIKAAITDICNLFTLKKETMFTFTHECSNTHLSIHFHSLQNNRTEIIKESLKSVSILLLLCNEFSDDNLCMCQELPQIDRSQSQILF